MENQNNPKISLSNIIFKIVYLIVITAFLFFYFFAIGRRESYVHGSLMNVREFIIMLPVLIIPMILPFKGLKWRFFTFLGLVIPLTIIGMIWIPYTDVEGLSLFVYDFYILVVIVISHYLLRYIQTKANNTAKIIGIVILLIILVSYTSYFIPSKISYRSYRNIEISNSDLLNEIQCKGAYTTTSPSELASLCNKIDDTTERRTPARKDYWILIKSHCNKVVEKIKSDSYYFDDTKENRDKGLVIRSPRLYRECPEPRIRPEVLDPNLCDKLLNAESEELQEYFDPPNGIPAGINCYWVAAGGTGQIELCEKTQFPHQCYVYAAEKRKDPTICDNIKINYAWNIDEGYIKNCKNLAAK